MTTPDALDGLPPSRAFARPAGTLRYVDEGTGPAVVCVHGNPTWAWYYRRLLTALVGDHRVIVPDHLGMGRSDTPDDDAYGWDLAARVEDLGALLDHLQVGVAAPATLVVHDWGGPIALTWAAHHPQRVGRVVLTNTAAFPRLRGAGFPWLLRPARAPGLGSVLVRDANAFVRSTLAVGVHRGRLEPAARAGYLAPYRTRGARTGVLRFVRDVPEGPAHPSHALLAWTGEHLGWLAQRPTMIVWGLRDPVLTPAYLAEWRRRLPDAEVHAIADAGHLVLEDAAESVPLIAAFLARTDRTLHR